MDPVLPLPGKWALLESDDEDGEDTNGFAENDPTEELIEELTNEIIDELSLGICFQVHRASKMGTLFLDETDIDSEKQYELVDQYGLDVFGQVPMKKSLECICPSCSRNMAASRFAPHLEKCMGMGRNSSRIASRRIANSGKRDSDNESENDNDNDNDWSYNFDRKAKKMKRDKSGWSPRRGKHGKFKNGDASSAGSAASEGQPAYDLMTLEDRKTFLLSQCGVISEHTKKMCTRSHKCPQHTDVQRQSVRAQLLGHASGGDGDDVQVDIDSYEDGDSQVLRDTLHWEAASNPSPADSTSTTASTGSKHKTRKRPYKKKKKSALAKGSSNRSGTPNSLHE